MLDPTEKERDTVNDGWCVESTASAAAHPCERAKTAALVKETVIVVDDGSCAWMAPTVPSVALPMAMVAGSAVVGGF